MNSIKHEKILRLERREILKKGGQEDGYLAITDETTTQGVIIVGRHLVISQATKTINQLEEETV